MNFTYEGEDLCIWLISYGSNFLFACRYHHSYCFSWYIFNPLLIFPRLNFCFICVFYWVGWVTVTRLILTTFVSLINICSNLLNGEASFNYSYIVVVPKNFGVIFFCLNSIKGSILVNIYLCYVLPWTNQIQSIFRKMTLILLSFPLVIYVIIYLFNTC